jgi:hypothetical protein
VLLPATEIVLTEVSDGGSLVLDPQRSPTRANRCLTPKRVYGRDFPCGKRSCRACGGYRNRVLGRMLVNDAVFNSCPTHVMTLTTHDPDIGSESFGRGVQSVSRRLRRHFERFDYFLKVEFTTGTAKRSGGHRRIHGHLCCKGLVGEDVRLVEGLTRETWEKVTGAVVVEVAEMITAGGALHYLGLHHGKTYQAPPASWRGMAERFTQGYLNEPVPQARARAREELAVEALAYTTGLSVSDAGFLRAQAQLERDLHEASFQEYAELRRTAAVGEASARQLARLEQLAGIDWGRFFSPAPVEEASRRAAKGARQSSVEPIDMTQHLGSQAWLDGIRRA